MIELFMFLGTLGFMSLFIIGTLLWLGLVSIGMRLLGDACIYIGEKITPDSTPYVTSNLKTKLLVDDTRCTLCEKQANEDDGIIKCPECNTVMCTECWAGNMFICGNKECKCDLSELGLKEY